MGSASVDESGESSGADEPAAEAVEELKNRRQFKKKPELERTGELLAKYTHSPDVP